MPVWSEATLNKKNTSLKQVLCLPFGKELLDFDKNQHGPLKDFCEE